MTTLTGSKDSSQARQSLRAKFILVSTAQTIIVALLIIGIQQYTVRTAIVEVTNEQGRGIASAIESTAGYYVAFGLTTDLKAIIADLKQNPSVEYADFIAANNKLLAASAAKQPPAILQHPLMPDMEGTSAVMDGARVHIFLVPLFESYAEGVSSRGSLSGTKAKPVGFFRLVMNQQKAQATTRMLHNISILVGIVAMLAGVVIATLTSRFIINPILSLAAGAKILAQGDLTQRTNVDSSDEIGVLAEAFNGMASALEQTLTKLIQAQSKLKSVAETVGSRSRNVIERVDEQRAVIDETYHSIDKLNGGVRKITENVESLSAASEQTSSSMLEMVASMEEVGRHTDTLFNSVEETASATHEMVSSINEVDQNVDYLTNFVTETSSSMVEMSASIAQVEKNAAQSYDLALAVAGAAESGMRAVRETIEGMEEIRQSVTQSNAVVSRLGERSAAIGKILTVIEDVAEQTNLLALNAAILAAQAGEHGKGFSVVAAEIRQLSERTASSTKEIAALITSVQHEVTNALKTMSAGSKLVEDGVALSHEAGKALNRILESSSKASGMGREIASATREQAKGSETVTRAVGRLQEMVKQINSATTQQAQGSDHIMKAVESMREVTKYVRQAMVEQKSGSGMISEATERMIDMIHEIFQVAANQSAESEKIVATMEQVRLIAEGNRNFAAEMSDSIGLLSDAIRSLDEEVLRFRVRSRGN